MPEITHGRWRAPSLFSPLIVLHLADTLSAASHTFLLLSMPLAVTHPEVPLPFTWTLHIHFKRCHLSIKVGVGIIAVYETLPASKFSPVWLRSRTVDNVSGTLKQRSSDISADTHGAPPRQRLRDAFLEKEGMPNQSEKAGWEGVTPRNGVEA